MANSRARTVDTTDGIVKIISDKKVRREAMIRVPFTPRLRFERIAVARRTATALLHAIAH